MAFNPMRRRIPLLKRLVPSVKRRWAALTWRGGYALRRSHGALFLLDFRNFVDRQIAFYDDFERGQIDFMLGLMRERGCDLFIDVGANIGLYSILVARERLARRLIAFEPDPRSLRRFGANIAVNDLGDRIELIAKAVSAESGEVRFQQASDDSIGQSHIGGGPESLIVAAVALDDEIAVTGRRIFIKMDIEGHELEAIAGATHLLRANRCVLQIECFAANLPKLFAAMERLGFKRLRTIERDHIFAND